MAEIVCRECGGKLEYKRQGMTQGWYCTKCAWNVVTSYFPPIASDTTSFELIVSAAEPLTDDTVQMLAFVLSTDLARTKEALSHNEKLLFEGMAVPIARARKQLMHMKEVTFEIEPEWPYTDKDYAEATLTMNLNTMQLRQIESDKQTQEPQRQAEE